MGKDQHVTPKDGRWQVKGAGNSRATKLFDTQAEAVDFANRQGRIRSKDSFGNDPCPPKDKEH